MIPSVRVAQCPFSMQVRSNQLHAACPRNRAAGARPRRSRARAFTLVEVLATLMLIAIALPVIMRGVSVASRAASSARRRNEACALAESKLNELIATNLWQTSGMQGDFSQEGWPDYTWTSQVQQWGQPLGASSSNIVQELDVQVSWTYGAGQQQTVTVSTLVYQSANATTGTGIGSGSSTGGF